MEHGTSFALKMHERRKIEHLNSIDFMPIRFLPTNTIAFDVELDGYLSNEFHIWSTRTQSGFKTLPAKQRDVLTLRLPSMGMIRWRDRRSDHITQPGQGFLLPFETLSEFEAAPNLCVLSCTISTSLVSSCYRSLEHDGELDPNLFAPVIDINTLQLRALAASLNHLSSIMKACCDGQNIVAPVLTEVFLYQLISAWPRIGGAQDTKSIVSFGKVARRARDYIDAHLAQPITIAEVAESAGVGVRSLQLAFRKAFDQSPLQYIIGARLDRAFHDLLNDRQASVAEIARRWGFPHHSDFTRRFTQRFGISPSKGRKH